MSARLGNSTTRRLFSNLAVECGSGEHKTTTSIATILLVLYNGFVPFAIYVITVRNQHRLRNDKAYRAQFAFLFNGFASGKEWYVRWYCCCAMPVSLHCE